MATKNTKSSNSTPSPASQLLAYAKNALRLTSNVFDEEVTALIMTAMADIEQATDGPFDVNNLVQVQAVALYCQAYFGYGDEKAERRYQDMLKRIGLRMINPANRAVQEG